MTLFYRVLRHASHVSHSKGAHVRRNAGLKPSEATTFSLEPCLAAARMTRSTVASTEASRLGVFSGHDRLNNVVSFFSVTENNRDAFLASFL